MSDYWNGGTNQLFSDNDVTKIDTGEVFEKPGRYYLESKEQYKERTGYEYEQKPPKRKRGRPSTSEPTQEIIRQAIYVPAELSEDEVMDMAKRMMLFQQSKATVTKFLVTQLDIPSYEAEAKVALMKSEIDEEFHNYIMSCTQDNILSLREILRLSLERGDTRNAVKAMENLDSMTERYLIEHGMKTIVQPIKEEKEDEIKIKFS